MAQRFSFQSTISPLPPFGALSSFEDELGTPKGSKNPSVRVRFEFPSQWSQIDKSLGGITLVPGPAPARQTRRRQLWRGCAWTRAARGLSGRTAGALAAVAALS